MFSKIKHLPLCQFQIYHNQTITKDSSNKLIFKAQTLYSKFLRLQIRIVIKITIISSVIQNQSVQTKFGSIIYSLIKTIEKYYYQGSVQNQHNYLQRVQLSYFILTFYKVYSFNFFSFKFKLFIISYLLYLFKKIINIAMETVKDYYKILGISHDASLFQIEQAYQKGALQWHPDKHKGNRAQAQRRFHDISEAYEILSDNNKRYKFDQILHKGYALDDANKTFESFFNEHDFIDEQEHNFFNKNFPQRKKTSYQVLGVPKNASLNQIKTAYRKLAIKNHPTNFNNSKQSQEKFVQINKAYQDLADPLKREVYDNWLYGEIAPIKAHNIFEDFYRNRDFQIPHEEEFFKPLLKKKWSFGLDKMMNDQDDFGKVSNGQTWKESTVYNNDNGIQTKKNIRRCKRVVNGIAQEVKTEDYLLPNGQRELIRTVQSNGKVQTKKYCFRKGENPPKQLLN